MYKKSMFGAKIRKELKKQQLKIVIFTAIKIRSILHITCYRNAVIALHEYHIRGSDLAPTLRNFFMLNPAEHEMIKNCSFILK